MMRGIAQETVWFLKQKKFTLPLILTAVLAYGFWITNSVIGIDDTAPDRYVGEGLAPLMGRWVLFLINKVFHIASYAPFITEVAAVICFIISVALWCAVFKRVLGDRIPLAAYTLFACIFISSPILAEMYTYYLQNAISFAYGITALAVLYFVEGVKEGAGKGWKYLAVNVLLLLIAVGCYESMMVVYVQGVLMVYLLSGTVKEDSLFSIKLWHWLFWGIVTLVLTVILRQVTLEAVRMLFRIGEEVAVMDQRSLSEVFQWVDGSKEAGEFGMVLKRFVLTYYINALVFYPIRLFVMAAVVVLFYCMVQAIRHRRPMILISGVCIFVFPVIMAVIEAYATHYRASQYVALVCAFAVLLLADFIHQAWRGRLRRWIWYGALFGLSVCTYNQCTEMNKWFYLDYLKYEDARDVMDTIAYELEKSYDISKPVIFVGNYELPENIVSEAGISLNTKEFGRVRRLADLLDVHLKEKYFTSNGYYKLAQTPYLSVLDWGVNAFDDTNVELFKFWEMHGHSFVMEKDLAQYAKAQEEARAMGMASWPREGYIHESEEYIIVKFGD